jgi:hypothetical protein
MYLRFDNAMTSLAVPSDGVWPTTVIRCLAANSETASGMSDLACAAVKSKIGTTKIRRNPCAESPSIACSIVGSANSKNDASIRQLGSMRRICSTNSLSCC